MSANLFDQIKAAQPVVALSPAAETELIVAAKAGDRPAQLQLLGNYRPLMQSELRKSSSARTAESRMVIEPDDLRMATIEAFYDALNSYDAARAERFGGVFAAAIRRRLYDESGSYGTVHVPSRTRAKFAAIVRAADGDYSKARDLAPVHGMGLDTYDSIATAYQINASGSADDNPYETENERGYVAPSSAPGAFVRSAEADGSQSITLPLNYVAVDVLHDTSRALAALDERERMVVGILYGIDGEALSERDAAEATGISRSTLQRLHKSALVKMHAAIA
jgi:DNA-directed RNA polymerase specialized sigma subunit